ncbi:MAG: FecR family protein, partial [Parasphingorhabdus sp.]
MIKTLIGKSVTTGLVFALMSSTSAMAQSGGWKLSETNGQVSVGRQGVTKTAIGGQNLRAGDVIRTGSRGRAVVTRGDQYMVVAANSHIKLANPETDGVITQVFNYLGNVLFKVDKRKAKHFGVETPYMAAVVKGTTFNVTVGAEGSTVQVTEGAVEVATLDGGAIELLQPGMIGMVSGADPFAMTIMGDGTRRIESPNRANTVPKAANPRTSGNKSANRNLSSTAPAIISQTISNQPVQLAAITNGLIEGNSPGSPISSFGSQSSGNGGQQDVLLATENVMSQILEETVTNFSNGGGNGNGSSNGQSANNGGGNGNSGAGDNGNNGDGNDPNGQDPSNPGQGNGQGADTDDGNENSGNGNSDNSGPNYGGDQPDGTCNGVPNCRSGANPNGNGSGDENSGAGDDGNNGGGNDPSDQDPGNPGQGNGNGGGNGSSNGQGANNGGGDNNSDNDDDGNNGGGNDPSGQDPSNPGQGNGNGGGNGNNAGNGNGGDDNNSDN